MVRRYREIALPSGRRKARARGIRAYRMVEVKPGTYIRVAITKRPGPQGGRTVAITKLKRKKGVK